MVINICFSVYELHLLERSALPADLTWLVGLLYTSLNIYPALLRFALLPAEREHPSFIKGCRAVTAVCTRPPAPCFLFFSLYRRWSTRFSGFAKSRGMARYCRQSEQRGRPGEKENACPAGACARCLCLVGVLWLWLTDGCCVAVAVGVAAVFFVAAAAAAAVTVIGICFWDLICGRQWRERRSAHFLFTRHAAHHSGRLTLVTTGRR